jgi:hypothetical protein
MHSRKKLTEHYPKIKHSDLEEFYGFVHMDKILEEYKRTQKKKESVDLHKLDEPDVSFNSEDKK